MYKRVINEFIELVKLDNPSKNERKVANYILNKLKELGYSPIEDDAGTKIGGDTGNIICKIDGDKNKDKIMFLAHMDSVVPCINKVPVINDIYIESDKNTVLGSDDLSGVGLLGAKELDLSSFNIDYAYVLDSGGEIGTASISAPSHITFDVTIKGKAEPIIKPQHIKNIIILN